MSFDKYLIGKQKFAVSKSIQKNTDALGYELKATEDTITVLDGNDVIIEGDKDEVEQFLNSLFEELMNDELEVTAADKYEDEAQMSEIEKKKGKDFSPDIKPEEAGDYVPHRETFDDVAKANKKMQELEKKGYVNLKITRYTKVEGEEDKYWWEVIGELQRTPELEEIKTKVDKSDKTYDGTNFRETIDEGGDGKGKVVKAKEVESSVKSKYKKQMAEKSEMEIRKALEELKEKLLTHELDKELYKEKIKVLEKLLTPKEVKEIDEKVEEKVEEKSKEKVEAFAEAFNRLKERAPADPKDYNITKTDKGYAVSEKGKDKSEGFVGDFSAIELEQLFDASWEQFIIDEVAASKKSVADIEKTRLKVIEGLMEEQEKLIDKYYNDPDINKTKLESEIVKMNDKIEGIKAGTIKVEAQPAVEEKDAEVDTTEGEGDKGGKGDVFDLTSGVALGEGFTAYKDEETGEIYVMDKDGTEIMRNPNSFIDDISAIIEFYRSVLNIEEAAQVDEDVPAIDDMAKEGDEQPELDIEKEEKEPATIEDRLDNIEDKVEEVLEITKEKTETEEVDEEAEESNIAELAEIKKEVDEKRAEVDDIVQSLVDNKKIVINRKDIQKHIIAGENPIFAKKKAIKEKCKALAKKLWAADSETIKVLKDTFINKTEKQNDNVSSILMFLNN